MQSDHNLTDLDALIGQFFTIDAITYGDTKQPFITRYNGSLKQTDSETGFNQIADALDAYDLMPILRQDGCSQTLLLLPKITKKAKNRPQLNLIMFLLTVLSVLFTGGLYEYEGDLSGSTIQIIWTMVTSGWPFAISLLAILSAHEFGHYFAGKKNGVDVTLPFFIPFPFSSFGTMGAFINMRSIPRNKRVLFDIAISGPLSGLFISIIVLLIGLNLSEVHPLPLAVESAAGLQMEGSSLLYLLLKYISFGKLLPQITSQNGLSITANWIQYFFTATPFPWGVQDVMLHPVAWAGWAGLFVTAINLLPVGQLDGGHIFQTVFGKKTAQIVFPIIIGGLALLGVFWKGWWLWASILFFLGRRYAEPLDQVTQLDPKQKWLGYLAILIFIITFIPVPITIVGL
ncbi:MAG: site-2 protease family protein [Pelolinea sp.]|nr:site-2 protease family protein [Pelolinea sp.]